MSSGTVPLDAYPRTDADVAGFVGALGIPGILDLHVHFLPDKLQQAVWRYFDGLEDPSWPIVYRDGERQRLRTLRDLGVVAHTALPYAHKPGMTTWLNDYTLGLAEVHEQVVPSFTFYPEDGVDAHVDEALARGGTVAKVHLQVGRFHATDPRLSQVWATLERRRIPIVLHASAVYGVEGGAEYCGTDEVRDLLSAHPDLRVIVAHLGAPDVADFVALAEETPSLHLDTAMVLAGEPHFPPVPEDLFPRIAALRDRIIFGSDFPSIPRRYAAQVRGLARLGLDAEDLGDVLHGTAAALLDEAAADRPEDRA